MRRHRRKHHIQVLAPASDTRIVELATASVAADLCDASTERLMTCELADVPRPSIASGRNSGRLVRDIDDPRNAVDCRPVAPPSRNR